MNGPETEMIVYSITVSDLNTAVCVAIVTLPCDIAGLMGV